jgi:chemotaxis protein MotB
MTRRTPGSEHGRGPTSGRPMVSPLWPGAPRIEFEETESEANGDPGWTVSYLDVLLVLVTVFAALLGITYLQAGTFESAGISESVTEAGPSSAHADPSDNSQDSGFLRQTLVVTPGLFYPPAPISKVASLEGASPDPSQPGNTKEVSSFESGQAMENTSPEPVRPVVIPSALKPLADFLVEHERFGDMDVLFDRHQLRVELNNDILFPSGSADLSLEGTALLEELYEAFSDPGLLVAVEGHTDNVPIQTRQFPSNWELSSFRATTVARTLMTLGVAEHRIKVTGYADTRPRAQNDTEKNRALNRRVSIVLELFDPNTPEI